MNHERMIAAANWMLNIHESKDKFDLQDWQKLDILDSAIMSYRAAHSCGATCCFGGWLALSKEFIDAGGMVHGAYGAPLYAGGTGFVAIAKNLKIGLTRAKFLADPVAAWEPNSYQKNSKDVTALDVAELLLKMVKEDLAQ